MQAIKRVLKRLPMVRTFLRSGFWQAIRYRITLRVQTRQNRQYTMFYRTPHQFDALCNVVLDFVGGEKRTQPLAIKLIGCSSGAEPYTLAAVLKMRHPNLQFHIDASDLEPELVSFATEGRYSHADVHNNELVPDEFLVFTFDCEGETYRVKEDVRSAVTFSVADALDPKLPQTVGMGDIVYAQNFLFHLEPEMARRAFHNICRLLKPRSALFVDGMDHGMKYRLTRSESLIPLEYRIREIHEDARLDRGEDWAYYYYGREPFNDSRRDWRARYGTIFLKSETPVSQ